MAPRKKLRSESVAKNNFEGNSTRPKRESQNRNLYDAASGTWSKTEARVDLLDSESDSKKPNSKTLKKTEVTALPKESSKRRRGRPRKIPIVDIADDTEAVEEINTSESQDSGIDPPSIDISGIQEKMKILDKLVSQVNRIILQSVPESGSSNLVQEEDAIPMGQQVDDYVSQMMYDDVTVKDDPVESSL